MKDFNIDMIRELTIEDAKQMAIETMKIKDHECIFVDFGGYFGYSVLVFKNEKHIHYADDFELHHGYIVKESGKEALKQWYIESLNRKLYTDAELLDDVKTYDEYEKKNYFLRNYYIMRYDYVSIFGIGEEAHKKIEEGKKTHPYLNPVSFCYVADKNIIKTQSEILKHLDESFEKLKASDETFKEMVSCELANHEACITCDYTDALDALGLRFDELTEAQQEIVKKELNRQIHAYCDAEQKEVITMINIDMWYGDKHTEADKIDVSFYPNDGEYRGNIYKNGKIIGDYSCNDSVELENTFSQLKFNW